MDLGGAGVLLGRRPGFGLGFLPRPATPRATTGPPGRPQDRSGRGAPRAAAADRRPRPTRALSQHAAHPQATLSDEPRRMVSDGVQPTAAAAVGADLLGWRRAARGLGGDDAAGRLPRLLHGRAAGDDRGAAVGAQPHLARPGVRRTAAASGAAATRLALVAGGMPDDHPTQKALGQVETATILAELALSPSTASACTSSATS